MNGTELISNPPLAISSFGFKAGQWVDLFIPNIEQVGGFSLVSTPKQLAQSRTLELAIKNTAKSSIVKHLFATSLPGDTFYLRTGGNFYYRNHCKPVLLIAGGVGIAPLFSILNHVLETGVDVDIGLVYSYERKDERVFRDRLASLEEKHGNFHVDYYCTEDDDGKRVKESDIAKAFDAVSPTKTGVEATIGDAIGDAATVDVYLCGPPLFESNMLAHLDKLPVKIYHEKWW